MPRRVWALIFLVIAVSAGGGLALLECATACADDYAGSDLDCGMSCCRATRGDLGLRAETRHDEPVGSAALADAAGNLPLPEPREILHVPKVQLL